MTGMDGFQILREKSADPLIRDIPVVVISALDPIGEPIVSNYLTVLRSKGLSMRDLMACIRAINVTSFRDGQPGDPGQPIEPAG
jgi:CheY-like chemotaxis protein